MSILRVARTEILEHRRQPKMLVVLGVNYILWISLIGAVLLLLDAMHASDLTRPELYAAFAQHGGGDGKTAMATSLDLIASTYAALMFTNMPLFVAIMAGYSVLHDRQVGSLPFLMLAPVSRFELLVGKLLGAAAIPMALHLVFVGLGALSIGQIDVLVDIRHYFGGHLDWWLAYLLGVPSAALFVGGLGTVISGLSRDVRTSMQFTSFFIGILSLVFGAVLANGITQGWWLQSLFVAACLICAVAVVGIGARVISRDITA